MQKILFLILLIVLQVSEAGAASRTAGTVIRLRGEATAAGQNLTRTLKADAPVFESDRIITGKNARLSFRLLDGTVVDLGENTEFEVSQWHFVPDKTEGRGILNFIKGFFRAASGDLVKQKAAFFEVRTRTAVIGVRGTTFWGGFRSPDFLEIALLEGKEITVTTAGGRVVIDTPGWGTTVRSGQMVPDPPVLWDQQKISQAASTITWK